MNYLTDKYTVVTYDRRGYSRSKIDDPTQGLKFTEESDDVHHLLAALTNKSAYVFGSSIGADIALDFATRYTEQICEVIAHEPPVNYLTKDPAKLLVPNYTADFSYKRCRCWHEGNSKNSRRGHLKPWNCDVS